MILLAGVISLAGCIKDRETEPEVRSGLTVVNSFSEAEAVLHLLDVGRGQQRLDQQGQAYRSVGFYVVPSCESCKLEIISSNELAQLVDTAFSMEENHYYSSFLYGTEESPRYFFTADHAPEDMDDDAAGLRFFNLAHTASRVTLHIADEPPMEAFRDRPTETAETAENGKDFVPTTHTGTHVLTIRNEAGEQLAKRTGVALDPGDYLTVFLTGDGSESIPYYVGVVRHRGVN